MFRVDPSGNTNRLDADEKSTLTRTNSLLTGSALCELSRFLGNTGQAAAISEGGLYKLIMRSDRPDEHSKCDRNTLGLEKGPKVTIVNESGLYKLIMRSDKPNAKAFQNWVTKEVLPSIRKTLGDTWFPAGLRKRCHFCPPSENETPPVGWNVST